ncbi:MAG: cell division topological specificity factor MinE [Phototrophicaceae bacterium]
MSNVNHFFDRLLGRNKTTPSSSQVLTSRLKLVLMQDRSNISSEKLKALREEILAVIAKYVEIDTNNVEFEITQDQHNGGAMLIAEIPFDKLYDEHKGTPEAKQKTEPTFSEDDDA